MTSVRANPWDQILGVLEKKVSPQNFETWLRPTSFSRQDDGVLFVRVPTDTGRAWITENYRDHILQAVDDLGLGLRRVELVADASSPPAFDTPAPPPARGREASRLNERYRFDTFVVGTSNQFAHAAARRVAHDPGGSYNPLFIYGGTGLGKTHLMQAVGHELIGRNSRARLLYVSAEVFVNEMIQSLKDDRMASFREWIRNVDCLLVDDVHNLQGKERTQEEFFHTFNTLYEARKQIVLTSDSPPKSIEIEERLRSRFEWGLIVDIQPPDLETRQAILMKKAEAERFDLPEEVAVYIAHNVKSNIRELEGCLVRLIAYSSLHSEAPSVDMAAELLKHLIQGSPRKVSIDMILKAVCDRYNLRLHEIKAKNNSKRVVFPRQVAMYLARELTHGSLPEIARAFGDKHHTTVLYALEKIARLRQTNRDFHREISQLMASFE